MKITNKTILVTGGGSGIGYATAKYLSEKGNKVIISGRNPEKIKKAGEALGITAIACDVTKAEDVAHLVARIESEFGDLAVLINNAGVANLYKLGIGAGAFDKSKQEFETNYFGPVRLIESLLPLLKIQPEAAIVNITSNVSFHPLIVLPTYSDSKAALHSHTVALRLTLAKETNIKLFEVMPSLIDTEATKDMGGANGLPPSVVAEDIFNGINQDRFEIYVGDTSKQHADYFADPVTAVNNFNKDLL
ncbi:SDR family oxidoreductase [Pedobacter sandarakinus]|uniref:SDR family oxidoreductase n=1 Tax=Pedobacter sandarakinus TaxID=353156 RepID=UPI00224546A6|nr:SDR family NAD(P)-dependent oxidoreductase [Pedobacter sandarakinus]MCX2574058.1 SDR family NAD(P)-dependent oxidoreductase [Pedobacter sandarakinus]